MAGSGRKEIVEGLWITVSCRFCVVLFVVAVLSMSCGRESFAEEPLNWDRLLNVMDKKTDEAPAKNVEKTRDKDLGLDCLRADRMEDGASLAVSEHLPGVRVIRTGSGVGFVATGAGVYERHPNPNATRLSQRQAYVVAFMKAKKELAAALEGLSVQGRETLAVSVFQEDTENKSASTSECNFSEKIDEAVSAVLKGYTTYEVYDDGENTVYVSLVSTPKTRSACRVVSGGLVEASSLTAGLDRVFREIVAGVVPPIGGRVVDVPETGEVAVVSFGSAIVREMATGAQSAQEKLVAQRRARARADRSMVALLKGDDYMWKYGFNASLDKESASYKDYVEDPNGANGDVSPEKNAFFSSFRESEQASSLVKGKLPEGVSSRAWYSRDGAWCYVAEVYTATSTTRAKKAADEMGRVADPVAESATTSSSEMRESLQETPTVQVDWDRGIVKVTGEAVAPEGKANTGQGKLLAKRGAMTDLQRNFLEFLEGVRIDSQTTMKDLMVEDDQVSSTARGLVKQIRVVKGTWDGEVYALSGEVKVLHVEDLVRSMIEYTK